MCKSTPGVRADLFQRDPRKALVTDFFGSVRNVEVSAAHFNYTVDVDAFVDDVDSDQEQTSDDEGQALGYVSQFPDKEVLSPSEKVITMTLFSLKESLKVPSWLL